MYVFQSYRKNSISGTPAILEHVIYEISSAQIEKDKFCEFILTIDGIGLFETDDSYLGCLIDHLTRHFFGV